MLIAVYYFWTSAVGLFVDEADAIQSWPREYQCRVDLVGRLD